MKNVIEKIFQFKKGDKLTHRSGWSLPENMQALSMTTALWPDAKKENYITEFNRPFHHLTILTDFSITVKLEYDEVKGV